MTAFRSHEECFQAVRELVVRLDRAGLRSIAAELREGFGCLNGLTDGWAQFLESIEKARVAAAGRLDPEDEKMLEAIRATARAAVRRR